MLPWFLSYNLISAYKVLVALYEIVHHMYNRFDETYLPPQIFMSHASNDYSIVEPFVIMLERIGVKQSQLFCSSIDGYHIPQGSNIYDYLREKMSNNNLFFIMMLSESYYKSAACLNKMGAAWIKQHKYQATLLPCIDYAVALFLVGRFLMTLYTISDIRNIVAPIAQQHGVKSISLFGSYSKGNADENSDIDLKIEKGALRSLIQICSFRLAIEDALSIPVDIITTESSDQEFLNAILKDEVLLYRNAE